MKIAIKEPNTLRKKGIELLSKELGPLGMAYFIRQFDTGTGDYSKERQKTQETVDVKEIVKEIYCNRKQQVNRGD